MLKNIYENAWMMYKTYRSTIRTHNHIVGVENSIKMGEKSRNTLKILIWGTKMNKNKKIWSCLDVHNWAKIVSYDPS